MTQLGIKIDVDTDRGTHEGVPRLVEILQRHQVPATFLFSLGPDNTGKAIRRIFRPGFLKKVARTNVAGNYGLRTLLNGTLLPAPQIGKRQAEVMRAVRAAGFACGIHCWDHFQWQDYLHRMDLDAIQREFDKARAEFRRVFGEDAKCAGAPGWQCNGRSLRVYDESGLLWASDTRGATPVAFFPTWEGETFRTLHLSTTLPTLDELMGRPEFPDDRINDHYLALLKSGGHHIHTIHAEIEGLRYADMFEEFLRRAAESGVGFFDLSEFAEAQLGSPGNIPTAEVSLGEIDGRSGLVAVA